MMRVDSGGGPSPEDELHQLFRHYLRLRAARQAHGTQPLGLAIAATRAVLLVEAQAGFCQQGIEPSFASFI